MRRRVPRFPGCPKGSTCRGHIRRDLMQQVLRAQRRRVNKFAPPDAHVRSPEFNLVLGPSLFLESVNHVNVYELRTKNEEQRTKTYAVSLDGSMGASLSAGCFPPNA